MSEDTKYQIESIQDMLTRINAIAIQLKHEKSLGSNRAPEREGLYQLVDVELIQARAKFPDTKKMFAVIAEELGELAEAFLHYDSGEYAKPSKGSLTKEQAHQHVLNEGVQCIAMLIRLLEEGDPEFSWRPASDPEFTVTESGFVRFLYKSPGLDPISEALLRVDPWTPETNPARIIEDVLIRSGEKVDGASVDAAAAICDEPVALDLNQDWPLLDVRLRH